MGLTDVLRQEMRNSGIRVTAVLPGATDTPGWGEADVDRARMMQPESVAKAVIDACTCPADTTPEKIILRPRTGDL